MDSRKEAQKTQKKMQVIESMLKGLYISGFAFFVPVRG
jgi:hypothetical protein